MHPRDRVSVGPTVTMIVVAMKSAAATKAVVVRPVQSHREPKRLHHAPKRPPRELKRLRHEPKRPPREPKCLLHELKHLRRVVRVRVVVTIVVPVMTAVPVVRMTVVAMTAAAMTEAVMTAVAEMGTGTESVRRVVTSPPSDSVIRCLRPWARHPVRSTSFTQTMAVSSGKPGPIPVPRVRLRPSLPMHRHRSRAGFQSPRSALARSWTAVRAVRSETAARRSPVRCACTSTSDDATTSTTPGCTSL